MPACLRGVGILGDHRIHWEKPLGCPFHFPETEGLWGEQKEKRVAEVEMIR